ncbi:MAG: class I SAM-dependent methyltransferase [Alphaproteobacteria bacterium]|nr:class I SAM-dependent methyltransferase [Alphaproteobacteria bacterium]
MGRARQAARNIDDAAQLLRELVAGVANQSDLINRKLNELLDGVANQSELLNRKFDKLIEILEQPGALAAAMPDALQAPPAAGAPAAASAPVAGEQSFSEAMAQLPLMIAERTYNTSHPDYDARLVRNFPGTIFNRESPSENRAFTALTRLATGSEVPDTVWRSILAEALAEASAVPHAQQVFERRAFIENYVDELSRKHKAHYRPGWVNMDDALFLYWLVRQTKPKKIVQCGVCNGLSASFMMLALAKNGPDGTLSVIDLPPVFDPHDPEWTVAGKVYGVVIPEGKTTGWMVPDAYRGRFEVWNGDAKELLPKMLDKVDSVDLFYHDSDHTYDHMMFEFREAKRKLTPGGLVIGDDISWNASLWDFADECGVPAYNFKGAVGVAFF